MAVATVPTGKGALRAPSFKLRASSHAELSHDGTRLAQLTQRLVVWDVPARKVAYEGKLIANEHHVVLSPDAARLAVKDSNGRSVFFDLLTQRVISTGPESPYHQIGGKPAFSADGERLLDVMTDATLRVWDVATGHEQARYPNFGYSAGDIVVARGSDDYFVALTKNGEKLSFDSVLRLPGMDAERAEVLDFRPRQHIQGAQWLLSDGLAVDDAGKRLVMGVRGGFGDDMRSMLVSYDLVTGEAVVMPLPPGRHYVRSIVVTDDGLVVASVQDSEQIRGRENDFAWRRTLELDHLYFFDATDGALLARWYWNDAWHLGHSPRTGALAIGSRTEPGGCLADAPFTLARRDWFAAHPRHRP